MPLNDEIILNNSKKTFNLLKYNKEFLLNAPIPSYLLNDPDFFDDVLLRGDRSVCSHILRSGQKVCILKSNGDNLLVKIIQKGRSELIGMLLNEKTTRDEALRALNVVDASTGKTPFEVAVELSDRIAIFEIVSPRK